MILVFSGFAQLFGEFGLGSAVVQKIDIQPHQLNSVFWLNIVIGFLLTLIFIVFSPLIANFYNEPSLKLYIPVFSSIFLINSLSIVQNSLLQKKMDFKKIAIIEINATAWSGLIAIIMAFKGFGTWSLITQYLISSFVSVILVWRVSDWRPNLSFSFTGLKGLINYGSNLLGFNVFNYGSRNVDNFLVGKFIGKSALGIYTRAYNLMLLPISQISSVISRVLFPAMCEIQNDKERTKQIYLKAIRIVGLITFPLMIGLLVSAENFVFGIFGAKWKEMIPIFQILCITGLLQGVSSTTGIIYTSQGRTDLMFKWGIFSGIVCMLSFIIGLHWGIIGIASAYVVSGYLILWYPGWVIPGKLINLHFREMLKNLMGPFFCSLAMGLIMWITGNFLSQQWPYLFRLFLQFIIGVFVYWTFLTMFKLKAYYDALLIFKETNLKNLIN